MAKFKDDELGLFRHLAANYPDFVEIYQQVSCIYHHAPVFELKKGSYDNALEMCTFSVKGRIVSHCGARFCDRTWKRIIHFIPETLLFAKYTGHVDEGPDVVDIALGIWSANSGFCFEEAIVRRDKNEHGEELPFGWKLDFVKCPACYQPRRSLERWIAVRGFSRRKRHDNLLDIINRMRMTTGVRVMTEADALVLLPKSTRYSGLEVLLPASTNCQWEAIDLANLRQVRFSDKHISMIFGKRNGVRRRALQRLRNGHYYLDSLRSAKVKSRLDKDNKTKNLTVIRCEVLASQRGEIYRVYLVINENGHYIKSPYSRCSCAAGNMFCAHMLGLLCFCHLCALNPTWNRIDFEERMPSNTDQLQRLVIPVAAIHEKNKKKNN